RSALLEERAPEPVGYLGTCACRFRVALDRAMLGAKAREEPRDVGRSRRKCLGGLVESCAVVRVASPPPLQQGVDGGAAEDVVRDDRLVGYAEQGQRDVR